MKKTAAVIVVMLIALFGISETAFAKHHHRRLHKKSTDANQPKNVAQTAGASAAGVIGPTDGASKTN